MLEAVFERFWQVDGGSTRMAGGMDIGLAAAREYARLLEPNPRVVSRELLTRDEFIPATIVNVLAGAWLQFEVHDWFSHGKNVPEEPFLLELADEVTFLMGKAHEKAGKNKDAEALYDRYSRSARSADDVCRLARASKALPVRMSAMMMITAS